MTTLYDTLGVTEHASDADIKRAYRRAAMKWHPDRNVGNEAAAHAAFHEVKAAYAILSDPAQRREYDTIFAAEMRRWAKRHEAEAHDQARRDTERAQREAEQAEQAEQAEREAAAARAEAEREAQARAEAETRYAELVALAMRYTSDGYNRDVVFGVLLGRHCDPLEAARIADSTAALHASRSAASPSPQERAPTRERRTRSNTRASAKKRKTSADSPASGSAESKPSIEAPHSASHTADEPAATHGNVFGTLWYHFLSGLKP